MLVGTISIKNLVDVINSINYLVKEKKSIIDIKRIRKYFKIEPSSRSKISFYWRILGYLENLGYLELIKIKPTKTYKLPQTELNLDTIIKNLRLNL